MQYRDSNITAEVIADSINSRDCRLTTMVVTFPRIILAEVNTHRTLTKSVSSSRAIPVSKLIERVKEKTALPVVYGKKGKGMSASGELDSFETFLAKDAILTLRDECIKTVEVLDNVGLHKQHSNRYIENFGYVTAIVSATEWENFFALRAAESAQPEIQELAYKMLDALNQSIPVKAWAGYKHIPFGDRFDTARLPSVPAGIPVIHDPAIQIAVARCARISYLNHEGNDDYVADINLFNRLKESGHWSAFEHIAVAEDSDLGYGNFRGWKQLRKFFDNEVRADNRVKKYRWTEL